MLPLASAPLVAFHSLFIACSNTWIQNLICLIRFPFKNLDTKSGLSFFLFFVTHFLRASSYCSFFLRSIKLLCLSPNLHSCSSTSSLSVNGQTHKIVLFKSMPIRLYFMVWSTLCGPLYRQLPRNYWYESGTTVSNSAGALLRSPRTFSVLPGI